MLGQTCFQYFAGTMTWQEAEARCVGWGGHLATIGSAAENQLVRGFTNKEIWIGYTDTGVEGTWTWADGSGVGSFQNFLPGQQDNCCGGEDCAAIIGNLLATTHFYEPVDGTIVQDGGWVDVDCNQQLVYGLGAGRAPVSGYACSRHAFISSPGQAAPVPAIDRVSTATPAPLSMPTPPQTVTSEGWVRILHNVSYSGSAEPAGYTPLLTGRFTGLKAVYLAGYITACEGETRSRCPPYRENRPWQNYAGCGDTAFSFELRKGGTYIVEQTRDGCVLPPQCQAPAMPAGDIVCTVLFTISPADLLVPTWYEASSPTCTGECRVRISDPNPSLRLN